MAPDAFIFNVKKHDFLAALNCLKELSFFVFLCIVTSSDALVLMPDFCV